MLFELVLYRDFSKSHGLRGGGEGWYSGILVTGRCKGVFSGLKLAILFLFGVGNFLVELFG